MLELDHRAAELLADEAMVGVGADVLTIWEQHVPELLADPDRQLFVCGDQPQCRRLGEEHSLGYQGIDGVGGDHGNRRGRYVIGAVLAQLHLHIAGCHRDAIHLGEDIGGARTGRAEYVRHQRDDHGAGHEEEDDPHGPAQDLPLVLE